MAVGRLDTFSAERVTSNKSVLRKSAEKIAVSQEKSRAAQQSKQAKTAGAEGVHLFSNTKLANNQNSVVKRSADNISGYIQGQLDGSGTTVDVIS